MAHEGMVDLDRCNFLAAAIDQLAHAAAQREETFRVEAADVTCSIPAVDEGGAVELGHVEIAGHHGRSTDQDFSLLIRRKPACVDVDDDDGVGPGDRKSTRLNSCHLGISYAV